MNEADVFEQADRALKGVVDQIADEHWGLETPEGLRFREDDRTLRDLVNHFASDDSWVPDVLAGKTAAEVGDKYAGDLLQGDPKRSFAGIVDTATKAVRESYEPDTLTHLSYGDFPAHVFLLHITIFRAMGVLDISKLIGVRAEMSAELTQGLWDMIEPNAADLRGLGVFPEEIPVPPDAPLRQRLLGLMGRDSAQ